MKPYASFAAASLVAVLAISCVSAPTAPRQARLGPSFTAKEAELAATKDEYAKAGALAFKTYVLSNGIPVIVKINPANRIFHVRLVLKGGVAMTDASNAGMESVMMRTMARGSAAYPYETIMEKLDATSSGMGPELGPDASAYSLNTLDKYFAELFPVWADTLTAPSFAEKDFAQIRKEAVLALEKYDQDPWRKTSKVLNDAFFAGHPYANGTDGNLAALKAMTRDSVKDYYARTFSANRMFIVAVGDFDTAALLKDLEGSFGKIPDLKTALPAVPPFQGKVADKLMKTEFPQAKATSYLRGDFAAPAPEAGDFMAANVGMKMFSDLLFDVVRSKYNAVYTPGAYIRANAANYGSITIFKTSSAADVKRYIDESLEPMARGYCLSTDPGAGEERPRQAIADALPVYLAQYKNETFEKSQTNAAVAAQVQASVLSYSDYRYFLLDAERIGAVTPEAVSVAMAKYVLDAPVTWNLLGSKEGIAFAPDVDYRGFPGAR